MSFRSAARTFLFVFALSLRAATSPTFAHDIAPILYSKCASCHRPGEAAPFPLLSFADARKRARQIAQVTHTRFMPPWLPDAGYGEFQGDLRLSTAEIAAFAGWAAAGAPEGNPADAPRPPALTEGWRLGPPDLILEAPAPVTTPATGPDLYWNFVFRADIKSPRWVRAIDIHPGERTVVHHANLLVDRTGSTHLRENTPGAGFAGMDLEVMRTPFEPEGQFLFWKPGDIPREEPEGFAWRLDPGSELVLNTHLHPGGKPVPVRPVLGIYFTEKPRSKYPIVLEMQNDQALNIPAGAKNFTAGDDFRLPVDTDVLGIYPHAHLLGKRFEAWADPPAGAPRVWLMRISAWDPAWQSVYYYRRPVSLPKGTVISMRWTYDNSAANPRNPHSPPQRVTAGNQTTDEMAQVWLQLLPQGPGDRRRELDQAMLEHRLDRNPADFEANLNLGAVMMSRLNPQGAVTAFEAAVAADPNRLDARNMLGLAFAATGRINEAIEQYRMVLRSEPGDIRARFNLANALVRARKLDEAIEDYRAVLAAVPDDAIAKERLAAALKAKSGP